MSEEVPVRPHNAERLKFFTDAVVAIALTLLVLPLLDSVPEAARQGQPTTTWLHEHRDQLFGLLVSFIVVASYWRSHHRLFEHVARHTPRLVSLNFVWMLVVVFLQVPTALVYALPTDRSLVALYVGTMCAGSAMLTVMAWTVYRDPGCQYDGYLLGRDVVLSSLAFTVLYVVALVVGVTFPAVNFYALLVLLLARPVRSVVLRYAGEGRTGRA
jgi:uncharacterized membrane protein